MWYFAWVLGVGFAVTIGILNGMWFEFHTADDTDVEDPYKQV
jgi:cytochrome bd-I ubiquinol oxidase subunit X